MKILFATLVVCTLLAPAAHADLVDFFMTRVWQAGDDMTSYYKRQAAAKIQEIPASESCAPAFIPGDDGIFQRIPYCHRANPKKSRGFLERGYDVPASFLAGYTVADTADRWQTVPMKKPEFSPIDTDVPLVLLESLNLKAAQAWEDLLKIANGDPELARELYRNSAFAANEGEALRQQLSEIRFSLRSFASSIQLTLSFDTDLLREETRETGDRQKEMSTPGKPTEARLIFKKWDIDMQNQWISLMRNNALEAMERYLPRPPRMHPLVMQIMYEELLALVSPSENPVDIVQRFRKNRSLEDEFFQLLALSRAVDGRDCSPFGLWPSANRAAIQAFNDKFLEIVSQMGGPNRQPERLATGVFCPVPSGGSPPYEWTVLRWESKPTERFSPPARLNTVYLEGRFEAWREVRALRERHVKGAR